MRKLHAFGLSALIAFATAFTTLPAQARVHVDRPVTVDPARTSDVTQIRDHRRWRGHRNWRHGRHLDRGRHWDRGNWGHRRGWNRAYRGGIYLGLGVPAYRYVDPYYDPYYVAPRRVYRPRVRGARAHVDWCYSRYRSYRASDNTFQPYNGPRRQCRSPFG
jgi:hypothetical protein